MFEQDYVMRLIKEMVRAILKLLLRIDVEAPTPDVLQDVEEKRALEALLDLVDEGRIEEAENRLSELVEDPYKNHLESAVLFYSYLNDKSDLFLTEHNFSREEVLQGLKAIAARYGIGDMAEAFLD